MSLFQPLDPESPREHRRRFRRIPLRVLVPNMVTLIALCSGLTAIRMSIEGRFEHAVIAILIAAVLDGVDGRLARLLRSTSRFGAELDSLADFVSFGVAPAILLYVWGFQEFKSLGWIVALVFAIAGGLRLARFNAALDQPARPLWQADFFTGMPAPAGAVTVLLPIYLDFLGVQRTGFVAGASLVYSLLIAFLMISRVPTFSGKRTGQRVPREMVLPLFVFLVLFVALLVSFTWATLTGGTLLYLLALPLGVAHYRRLERQHDTETAGTPPPEPDQSLSLH
ncbi:MAG: CDP-diacylglycerol--serine O-phosphatidyltransferase [Pseudomonadota bacterium]|nr:CDP-diacylglycerol--serine O-phosphatidyltransferase [Pseudomonadota bacterium]